MKTKIPIVLLVCFLLSACTAMQSVHVQLNYTPRKNRVKTMPTEGEKANLRIAKIAVFDKRVDQKH